MEEDKFIDFRQVIAEHGDNLITVALQQLHSACASYAQDGLRGDNVRARRTRRILQQRLDHLDELLDCKPKDRG